MAKVISPFQCSGSIGHVVFRVRNGQQTAHLKGFFDRKKWRNNRRAALSHLNAQEFGGAAKCACAIYNAIRGSGGEDTFRPYAHNHIARLLRRHAVRRGGPVDSYNFRDAIPALRGLDLSREGSPSKQVSFHPIGPVHRPTHVRVQGLREAAHAIDPTGRKQLEFRVVRRAIHFPEMHYHAQDWEWRRTNHDPLPAENSYTTPWITVDSVPGEGIRLHTASAATLAGPERPILVFLQIEWRELRPQRKPKELKGYTIVRLGAILATAEEASELTLGNVRPRPARRYHKQPNPMRRVSFKKAHPQLYLAISLWSG